MANMSRLITVRITESEYSMLQEEALHEDRTVSYIAREKMRAGMKNMSDAPRNSYVGQSRSD